MNILSLSKIGSQSFRMKSSDTDRNIETKRKNANKAAAYKKFCKRYNVAKLLEAIEETSRLLTQMMHEQKENEDSETDK